MLNVVRFPHGRRAIVLQWGLLWLDAAGRWYDETPFTGRAYGGHAA